MLALGHPGITLGAAALLAGLLPRVGRQRRKSVAGLPGEEVARRSSSSGVGSWFARLGNGRDIRLLLVGSLLPDIIDKPVGSVLFRESLSGGRIFSHTLLFLIVMTLAGLFRLRRSGKNGLLVLAAGTLAHLILDEIWLAPETLFWPLLGLDFPRVDLTGWIGELWYAMSHDPALYVPEIIGGAVIILFLWVLVSNRTLRSFIRRGGLDIA